MNFISTFDELDKLYEEVDVKQDEKIEEACKEELIEAAEDEVVEDEIPVEEIPAEEPVAEDEPRQVICECDKCGALVIKDEADIVVDEETDLVNVEDECQFCEEAKGFKIVGVVAPYEVTEAADEEPIEEGLFDKFKNNKLKKPKKDAIFKKDVIRGIEIQYEYTMQRKKACELEKGDYIHTKGHQKLGTDVFERIIAVDKINFGGFDDMYNITTASGTNAVHKYDGFNVLVIKNISEDLTDLYRKTFDKPASIRAQQAWEDELNGEMGEISDKRRAHLEKKFAQQRDWEARHPGEEVK